MSSRYYNELGVKSDATQDEIHKAYRRLARKYHPDINKEPGAEDRFKRLNEAHEVLKDPKRRRYYDQFGDRWKAAMDAGVNPNQRGGGRRGGFGGRGHAGGDFGDIFETFFRGQGGFGGGGGGFGGGFGQGGGRGADHKADVKVTLEELYNGATRELTLQLPGKGPKTFQVTIPAGTTDGKTLRLAGQGGAGMGGAASGDLLLTIKLIQHPVFEADGHDLSVGIKLQPWQAALGDKVQVPTMDGPVSMKIPAGVQGGQRLRLRGKGLPKKKGGAGDLFARIDIQIPKKLSDQERELYEKLSALSREEV